MKPFARSWVADVKRLSSCDELHRLRVEPAVFYGKVPILKVAEFPQFLSKSLDPKIGR
jgi:hypothetical protein